jgi:hypothetical protein
MGKIYLKKFKNFGGNCNAGIEGKGKLCFFYKKCPFRTGICPINLTSHNKRKFVYLQVKKNLLKKVKKL